MYSHSFVNYSVSLQIPYFIEVYKMPDQRDLERAPEYLSLRSDEDAFFGRISPGAAKIAAREKRFSPIWDDPTLKTVKSKLIALFNDYLPCTFSPRNIRFFGWGPQEK